MSIWQGLLSKLGLGQSAERYPLSIFVLDDDPTRHDWFESRFSGDQLDTAIDPAGAFELLSANHYDAIFLDHDLLPEHYHTETFNDDERTGYAVAAWLASRPAVQTSATIIVHTRNADGAMRMVELLRGAGRVAEYVPFPVLSQKIRSYWQR